jgi:hypothetical protein
VDLLVPAAARGQDEDRHREPGVAPAAEHGQTVHARQAEVEDHRVVLFGLPQKIRALAVSGAVHGIARLAERRGQLLRDP